MVCCRTLGEVVASPPSKPWLHPGHVGWILGYGGSVEEAIKRAVWFSVQASWWVLWGTHMAGVMLTSPRLRCWILTVHIARIETPEYFHSPFVSHIPPPPTLLYFSHMSRGEKLIWQTSFLGSVSHLAKYYLLVGILELEAQKLLEEANLFFSQHF